MSNKRSQIFPKFFIDVVGAQQDSGEATLIECSFNTRAVALQTPGLQIETRQKLWFCLKAQTENWGPDTIQT